MYGVKWYVGGEPRFTFFGHLLTYLKVGKESRLITASNTTIRTPLIPATIKKTIDNKVSSSVAGQVGSNACQQNFSRVYRLTPTV